MRFNLGKTIKSVALGSALAAVATTGFAATDGVPGTTSTGTLDIDLIIADQVRISGMSDILLPFTGGDAIGASDACIYRNTTGTYQIIATGDGAGGAFTLTDGTTPVAYAPTFDDGTGASALVSATALTAQSGADNEINCANTGLNASVGVTVDGTDAAALAAGTYAGTLTLVVSPE
ncbi:MAG: hypothetical protein GXP16_09500 [Gammaproteobacteria bacterium]|nr:hypothetical protein [Gammaproteobacteria bacterium]